MPFQPDDTKLVALINTILDAFAAREIDRGEAMSALAHVMTAAAIGGRASSSVGLSPKSCSAGNGSAAVPASRKVR